MALGNRTNINDAGAIGRSAAKARADVFAANVLPLVASIRTSGVTTLTGITTALNSRGVRTPRGGQWHVSTVQNLLKRAAEVDEV